MATIRRPSGKATEFVVTHALRKAYQLRVDIQRLPDKYDTGKYEDVRPCDHLVIVSKGLAIEKCLPNVFYIESKETLKLDKPFNFKSVFRKGQIQGMHKARNLKIPYFVVFNLLTTQELFLVPAFELLNIIDKGGKSISIETIRQYPWTNGELYDFNY